MEAQLPQLPVTKYTKRDQRDGLSRRLGFSSIEQVAKNKHKIVNEQKIAMKNLKEQQFGNTKPVRPVHGKNLVGRKLRVDKKWNNNKDTEKKKKKVVKEEPPKSLEDLDKEMDDYFNTEK